MPSIITMCLNANKIKKKGQYKESSYKARQGDTYEIETWGDCGSCAECMAEKANNWLVRNYYEEKSHNEKCFITLTYKDNPKILIKKHLQDFIKRLRKKLQPTKIRYFGCGEYGTKNYRPHYHLIIYGWQDPNAKYKDINKKGNIIKESEIINTTWSKGLTSYQEFNSKEVPYIHSTIQQSKRHRAKTNVHRKTNTHKSIQRGNSST